MSTKRILLIDDIREVTQVSLELMGGWKVLTARSGREGLAKAMAEQPEAILLDVMMPDVDGPTTFQKLQDEPTTCHIPTILLTARVQPSDHRLFSELGVQGLIAKPFDPLRLAQQVDDLLGEER